MTTLTLPEVDEKIDAHRKAVAFLKGTIIGFATEKGMKYKSKREPNGVFATGVKYGKDKSWIRNWITILHILYNRIRHLRPHTGSIEGDDIFLQKYSYPRDIKEKILEISGIEYENLEVPR